MVAKVVNTPLRLFTPLCKNCPYSESFWSTFSPIRTEYSVRMYSDWILSPNVFGLNSQSECGKMRTRITPNTDTFHEVKSFWHWHLKCFRLMKRTWEHTTIPLGVVTSPNLFRICFFLLNSFELLILYILNLPFKTSVYSKRVRKMKMNDVIKNISIALM